jgi:hypothetical protein
MGNTHEKLADCSLLSDAEIPATEKLFKIVSRNRDCINENDLMV